MKQDITTREKVEQIVTAFLSEDWDNCGGKADTIQGQVSNLIDQLDWVVGKEAIRSYDHGFKTGLANAKVISNEEKKVVTPHWMDCNCVCHGFHDNDALTCPHCHPEMGAGEDEHMLPNCILCDTPLYSPGQGINGNLCGTCVTSEEYQKEMRKHGYKTGLANAKVILEE